MKKRIEDAINALAFERINRLSFNTELKSLAVEVIDQSQIMHQVEFTQVDTYFFLDEQYIETLYEETGDKRPIALFNSSYGEIVAVDVDEDGSTEESTISQPNVLLNTARASIILEASRIKINGVSYHLNGQMH